ncbi:MAG: choice-of-anchor D domain-containing protein [bacterium]|nr:MAG: choice-of-anchor D domain-containing protein [bacterium]
MKYSSFLILLSVFLSFQSLPAQPPDTLWIRTFGGSNIDIGHAVQQTRDGGYIITGYTRSYGLMSGRNVWLVKTDTAGNEEWNNAFGGNNDEEAYDVYPTNDGGYVFTGYTESFGLGLNDVLLMKADSSGNSEWIRTFGGAQDDEGYSLCPTTDGGFIVAGVTSSSGAGSRDVFLIKTDGAGNEQWQKTLGGFSSDGARSVQQTSDGGYIITGWTLSYGPGFLGNAWLVKTDSLGNLQWDQVFGGTDADRGYCVQETGEGGYIFTGYTSSFGAGLYDLLLIKTDPAGNELWNKTFGGSGRDYGHAVRQTSDGGYIVTGYTLSFGAGGDDLWVIKADSAGNEEWSKTYGGGSSDIGYDVRQTSDGGYIVTGHTLSYGAGVHDVFLIRLAAPALANFLVTPDSLWFGNVAIGDTLMDSVTVYNIGNADLIIDSVTSSNPFYSVFPDSGTIAPDSSLQFMVQFSASSPGNNSGVLVFHHNGSTSPDSVMMRSDVIDGISLDEEIISQAFILYQNYPNPFNPKTAISWQLTVGSDVALEIYNIRGQKIATPFSAFLYSGAHSVEWDASNMASGVYLYRLQAGDYVEVKKMLLMR